MKPKTKHPEIKAILFDFGNVLIVDTAAMLEEMFHLRNFTPEERLRYVLFWKKAESGLYSIDDLMAYIKKTFHLHISQAQLKKFFLIGVPIEPVWEIFEALRGKYKVGIMTNNMKGWPQKQLAAVGRNPRGIKIFNSADIGAWKPDPKIYNVVLKKLRVRAEQAILIDDKERNIIGARNIGMHGIKFNGDMRALRKDLNRFKITF